MKIVGICRLNSAQRKFYDVLCHLEDIVSDIIVYCDFIFVEKTKYYPLVYTIIKGNPLSSSTQYISNSYKILLNKVNKLNVGWVYVFESDEFDSYLHQDDKHTDVISFRLFHNDDNYDGADEKKPKSEDPGCKDILGLFRDSKLSDFKSREIGSWKGIKSEGYVREHKDIITYGDITINQNLGDQNSVIDDNYLQNDKLSPNDSNTEKRSNYNRELIDWTDKSDLGFPPTKWFESFSKLPLRVLVATHSLNIVGGTETFTYTFLEELKKYPLFEVEYFTLEKGSFSDRIERELLIPFMSQKKYDVIFFNHNTTFYSLKKRHKLQGVFIQTCHGIFPDLEQPHAQSDGFVSISQEVQEHLALKGHNSIIIPNMINLHKFKINQQIREVPQVILSLCHSKEANAIIKELANQCGLIYKEAYKYENAVFEVQDIINEADIVVGLGRSALEAVACGRPVIIFDKRQYFDSYADGYLLDFLGLYLQNNCSGRYSKKIYSLNDLKAELKKYDPSHSLILRDFAIKTLSAQKNVVKYLNYYLTIKHLKENKTHSYWVVRQVQLLQKVGLFKFIKLTKEYLSNKAKL